MGHKTSTIMQYFNMFSLLFLFGATLSAQPLLQLDEAVETALANNHQIRLKKSNAEAQQLRVDPALVGRAPVANLQASYELGWSDAHIETLPTGPGENPPLELNGISNDLIIAPEVSLVLLDGKAGSYRLDQLSAASRLAQLELQQTIEQTIANVSTTYLQLAELQTQLSLSQQRIALTQDRLLRAQQDASYGTSSSLQELQIAVDLKTDSASLRDLTLAYDNARRELNRIMGQPTETIFGVDTELTPQPQLQLGELEQQLRERNTILRLRDEGVRLSELDVQLSKAAYRPQLQTYANVSYAYLQNDASFLTVNRSVGPNVGLRLSYPLFDGGARRINEQTAILAQEQSTIERDDTEAELIKELRNAFATYRNTLDQLRIEESNLNLFELNLENMRNMYRLGTATNTDVRTAQLNLDAARNRLSSYRYRAKQAEVMLYLLSGQLFR